MFWKQWLDKILSSILVSRLDETYIPYSISPSEICASLRECICPNHQRRTMSRGLTECLLSLYCCAHVTPQLSHPLTSGTCFCRVTMELYQRVCELYFCIDFLNELLHNFRKTFVPCHKVLLLPLCYVKVFILNYTVSKKWWCDKTGEFPICIYCWDAVSWFWAFCCVWPVYVCVCVCVYEEVPLLLEI